MKEGWKYKKLGEICHIGIGRTPSRSDMSLWDNSKQTHNYWVSIADMGATDNGYITDTKEYISDKAAANIQTIPKGTLLLSFKLTLGKTAIAGTDLYTNEAIANLPFIGNEVNREFLSYYFQYFNWEKYSAGDEKVLGKTLNKKKLDVLPVYYPVPSEQQRIVSRLDAAFAHIDEMKANAEKQLSEARALFQKALTKAMEPKEGWEEKTLKEIGLTQTGTTPSKDDKANYGDFIPFIRPSEIDFDGCGNIDYDSEMKLSEEGVSKGRLFKAGSILMVCIGATISKVGFLTRDVSCNQQINVLTPPNGYDFKFIYYAMRNKDFKDMVIKEGTSSQATLPIINKGKWEKLSIAIPPLSEQKRIVSRLDSLSAHVRELEEVTQKTIAECDALKQALLRKVFE